MTDETNGPTETKTRFWWFDEIVETTDSKDQVRQAMTDDGYIEGLEWGFNMTNFVEETI